MSYEQMTHDELLQLIVRVALEGRSELYLSGNKVTELPQEIGQLTDLKSLKILSEAVMVRDISAIGDFTLIPPEIGQLSNLQHLQINGNWLSIIPSEIGQLINLQILDISNNFLMDIPPEIGLLLNLRELNLANNHLRSIPSEIGQLLNLQKLYLGGRGRWRFMYNHMLTILPPEIGQLANLQELYVTNTQLIAVPPEVYQLTNLQKLDLGGNQLTSVPSEIGLLTNLQELDLGGNQLTSVPSEIGLLTNLQELDLGGNQLTSVPSEIGLLTNLQELDLGGNQLTSVPSEIGLLTNLQELDLGGNQLTSVPSEIGQLDNLKRLKLESNQLTTLPSELRSLKILKILYLYNNPLTIPSEILGNKDTWKDPQIILNTYFQVSYPLLEAKLLLVGEGGVGKSSLVERLLHNQPPSDVGKTIGVDIHRWELAIAETSGYPRPTDSGLPSRLRVNVWDFGGQEIYHATHQFFLTHRSLYLVVLEARKDEIANRVDYWLRHVQSFAGEAPIILAVNKSDQGRLALDERGLMLKYPTIQAIVHTSCTTGAGIAELRQAVETALASLPHINDWIPLTWFEVKEQLAALDKDTLPYENYVELCQETGIEHETAQRTLARFLHDLGAALNFQDDRRLASTHVLNPEWITGGIYHILNAEELQEKGLLHLNDLDHFLDRHRYPPEKHFFLLEMMHKFELSVPMDRERYLIPGLLPKTRPPLEWPEHATPALEYRYAILPAAILSRLMVRLYSHIWKGTQWRNGFVIHGDGCRALIIADPTANLLSIALDGQTLERRRLLAVVRAQLEEIHASFARLEEEAWAPLPNEPDKAIQYQALLNLEAKGITTYYDPVNDMELDVVALLDGIEAPDERAARPLMKTMIEHFNMDELRTLCFGLGIDCEMWPDQGKPALVRNLVLHFLKQGRLKLLEEEVMKERPFL